MMAISNAAEWFTPTAAPVNEANAGSEATAQTEFAALLAASYIAPSTPAVPRSVMTNAAEASPGREAIMAATAFVLPTDALPAVATSPIMMEVKAAEETSQAFPAAPAAQALSPTEQKTKAAVATNSTAQTSNEPLPQSLATTKVNLEKLAEPEKPDEQVPNLPTPIAIERGGNHRSAARTTAAKQVVLPEVAAQGEQNFTDVRVAACAALPNNLPSHHIITPGYFTQTEASFVEHPLASKQQSARDKGQNEFATKATLPQSQAGQEKLLPEHIESLRQFIKGRKDSTVVAVESLTSISPAVVPRNSEALKPTVAAMKTIVTDIAAASSLSSTAFPAKETLAAGLSTPIDAATIAETVTRITTANHDAVNQLRRASAETVPPPDRTPTPLQASAVTAQTPVKEIPVASVKSVETIAAFQTDLHRAPTMVEPVVVRQVVSQQPPQIPPPTPTDMTQMKVTIEQVTPLSTQLPELTATPEAVLFESRSVQFQISTTTEPVSTDTPTPTNNFAATGSSTHTEFLSVTASSTQQEFAHAAVPPAHTDFTHTVPQASAQEPKTVASVVALLSEESNAEKMTPSSLLAATQASIHPAINSQPHLEAPAGDEAQPLVHQTIVPVIELAQRLEASSTRSLRLQLNPIALGRIEVEVKRDAEGRVSAVLKVEQAEAAQILTQNLGQLRENLERAGLVVEQLDVTFTPPLPSSTAQPFGQPFGQPTSQQHSSPSHFTKADSSPAESVGAETTAPAADQKLLSLRA